jgi:general secretion pathway protein M
MKKLSRREWLALGIGSAFLLATILYGAVFAPWRAAERRLNNRIAAQLQQLSEIERLADDFRQLAIDAGEIEQRLARSSHFQLLPFLERLVDNSIGRDRLLGLRPQPVAAGGPLREERVELQLQRLRLDQLVRLLHAIDSAEACVATTQLRLRQRFDDTALLDVEITVSAYGKQP